MQHISDVKIKEISAGIDGRYVHGDSTTLGYLNIKKGSGVKLHNHIHEQITFVLEGELEMEIGGETMVLKPGNYFVIHSNVMHSARALTDVKVIDVFSPVREDYR